MGHLVDTNVLVDLLRGNPAAADYLDGLRAWSVSSITCLELLAGARTQRETDALDVMLRRYRSIAPTEKVARGAYGLMKRYARSHGLHPLDALIAATAIQEGLILSSRNRKHFEMIAGLKIEVPIY